jgi:A/G-specific adenine glycosylase
MPRPHWPDARPLTAVPPLPDDTIRTAFATQLVAWQRTHGRHRLPWQGTRDPYRVWLSEIMLQQTQVATVLGYYERFLQRFPDVRALAAAPLDEVLALWAGLGYYSRARNLHRCAQQVVAEHGGEFPRSAEGLATLPGIGRSTAAAIAAFCHGERAAILDGNVKRVLTRVLAHGEDLSVARHERALWDLATTLLPQEPADMPAYTQGLMDLGATVCLARSPNCLLCPVQGLCRAHAQGRPEAYPVKTRKPRRSQREHWWLWLEHEEQVCLQQRPDTGVWAGLYSLPEYDCEADLYDAIAGWPGEVSVLPRLRHVLTHFDWWLNPVRLKLARRPRQVPGQWVAYDDLGRLGLPAPLARLLDSRTG